MHKHIFIISALAICLLSCSSSEQDDLLIPEPQQGSISFGGNSGSWQDAPISRAGETGLETIEKSFRVWGYKNTGGNKTDGFTEPQKVMDGYIVKWNQPAAGSTGNWEYSGIVNTKLNATQTVKYWDYSATCYRYFAFSPENANVTTTLLQEGGNSVSQAGTTSEEGSTNQAGTTSEEGSSNQAGTTSAEGSTNQTDKASKVSFQIPFEYNENATSSTTPYISDLWLSDNQNFWDDKKYGACVKLTFAPIVTKVSIKFKYPENITNISIKNISFQKTDGDVPTAGNIRITYPITGTETQPVYSWVTTQSGSINLSVPYEEEKDKIHQTTERGKWYFVPPIGEQGTYTMTATINGKTSTAIIPAEYMQWKAGYQYTYIFKITEAGTVISFTNLLVEKWKESAPIQNTGGTVGW